MKKAFLGLALALSFCLPVYAEQFTNSESQRYDGPVFEDEEEAAVQNDSVEPKKSTQMKKQEYEPLPIKLSAQHAEYDSTSGDFHANGKVVIIQGKEKLLATSAVGNMKTGDLWLEESSSLQRHKRITNEGWEPYRIAEKTPLALQDKEKYLSAPAEDGSWVTYDGILNKSISALGGSWEQYDLNIMRPEQSGYLQDYKRITNEGWEPYQIKGRTIAVVQGKETIMSAYAEGNMKTGDIWLPYGGTLKEPNSTMNGKWVHYNFNTKTGEIKEITGTSLKDIYNAPHATIYPDKIVVDQGGTSSRCPAVKHPPCLSIQAETFEIYPREKMVAHNVKVFVRGKHVYSRDLWINSMNDEETTKIRPRLGYDGSDNGLYAGVEITQPVTEKTSVQVDLIKYDRAGYKPVYGVRHHERNFNISYMYGWDEDDGDWYKKQNTWRFDYKKHHIMDGLPLSYSGYFEYGLWQRENRNYKSWHKEYAVYLNHDPIYLFNTKDTVLNLTVGKKWVNESYTGDTRSTNMYYATLGQRLTPKWRTWIGYYQEDVTSTLFDIGQPDMAKEVRNGLQYNPDDRNQFSIVNRYDAGKGKQYETDYRWFHKFCCWAIDVTYEHEQRDHGDSSFKIMYYFYNL